MANGNDALTLVEEMLATVLREYDPLAGKRIITDQSKDTAPDDPGNLIRIYTVAASFEAPAMADDLTLWIAIIEFESSSTTQIAGTISAENRATLGNVHGALAQDRTLGGKIQDIQEIDMAAVMPNGRDVGAASLQYRVEFYTSRDDWFALVTN